MKKFLTFARFFSQLILAIVCLPTIPILVLLALPFANKDSDINIFPSGLQWLNTWDDPGCNQGEYEPQVMWVFETFGWRAKTWYWLGIRNQAYGLFNSLAPTLRFYTPALTYRKTGNWLIAEQDGKLWFDYVKTWKVGVKTITFRAGWKLFSITQYLDGSDKTGVPARNRPGFDLIVRVQ